MKRTCPKVGYLVKLRPNSQGWAPEFAGIVVKCVGIECYVRWTTGEATWWQRSQLEVISESR